MTEIARKKFEILNYTLSDEFTVDGLADKLNELTKLTEVVNKNDLLPRVSGWLDIDSIAQLDRGDIIKHRSGGNSYVVNENYGNRVTAVDTRDITNASEWLILACR